MGYRIKRIYDEPAADDGYRVLVDRLWPRGVSTARARLDEWDKDVAPSDDLRRWYGHDPSKLDEFAGRFRAELDSRPDAVEHALAWGRDHPTVTLLFGARDPETANAAVLRDSRRGRLSPDGSPVMRRFTGLGHPFLWARAPCGPDGRVGSPRVSARRPITTRDADEERGKGDRDEALAGPGAEQHQRRPDATRPAERGQVNRSSGAGSG